MSEKEIRKEVIKILKEYKVFKISIENKEIFKDKQEILEFREQKCAMIDRIFDEILSEEETKILRLRYLSDKPHKDSTIIDQLLINKDQYYSRKANGLKKFATALMIN